jgi:LPS export ABC transporter permease LptG/LPS export ABC transporter permease LptF
MPKIDKLLLKAIAPPFGIAFLVLTFVVFLNEFGRLSELLITRNAGLDTILAIAGTILPSILIFSLPLAYLIGVLIGLSGLSGESQIVALRACGVPLRRLLRPVIALAAVSCSATALLSIVVMPRTNDSLRALKDRISVRQITSMVQARVFNEDFPNLVFYIDDLSVGRQRWSGVFLSDSTDPQAPRTVLARNGSWVTDDAGVRLQLHLEQGVIYEVDPGDPGRDRISYFDATDVPVDLMRGNIGNDNLSPPSAPTARVRKPEEMWTSELWHAGPPTPPEQVIEQRVELHRRLAVPFSVIGFSLLGLTLGISTKKGGRTSGFVLSLIIVLLFYVFFGNGLRLARAEKLPPWLGAWAANILLCGIGIALVGVSERAHSLATWVAGWKWPGRLQDWARRERRPDSANRRPEVTPPRPSTVDRSSRLPFPRLLDVYVSSGFIGYFCWAALVCASLFVVLTLFDLLDDIIRNRVPWTTVVGYFVFLMPQILMLVVPMSILLAVLINFGVLERHAEITALKAGGWSLYRIAVPILLMAAFVCTNLYFLQDYVVPYSNIRQDQLRNIIKGRPARTSMRPQRKWVFGESGRIFNYDYFDSDQNLFVNLNVFEVDLKSLRLKRRLHSERAQILDSGEFKLENGWVRDFRPENAGFRQFDQERVGFPERTSYFKTEIFEPKESSKLTYLELKDYISYLKKAGYNATELQVALYRKIAFPLSCVVMAVLALPFSFSMGRRGAFFGITLSIMIAISYWGIFSVFEKMGAYGLLIPLLAAWAPNMLFAASGLVLLFTIRT